MPRPRRASHRPLAMGSSHWREDGQPKVRYATQREAVVGAAERSDESGVELNVYRCDFCDGWHMGRPGGRVD